MGSILCHDRNWKPQSAENALFRSWLAAVFSVSDAELMHTAGLDALIYHRAFTFGILFLSPTTVLALTVCAFSSPLSHPLHALYHKH